MKIILSRKEMKALETMMEKAVIALGTKIERGAASIGSYFVPTSDKWGSVKKHESGVVEINITRNLVVEFAELTSVMVNALAAIANSVALMFKTYTDAADRFDRRWTTSKYMRLVDVEETVLSEDISEDLRHLGTVLQIWTAKTHSGTEVLIVRTPMTIEILTTDNELITKTFYVPSRESVMEAEFKEMERRDEAIQLMQEHCSEEEFAAVRKKGFKSLYRSFDEHFVMGTDEVLEVLEEQGIIKSEKTKEIE